MANKFIIADRHNLIPKQLKEAEKNDINNSADPFPLFLSQQF